MQGDDRQGYPSGLQRRSEGFFTCYDDVLGRAVWDGLTTYQLLSRFLLLM